MDRGALATPAPASSPARAARILEADAMKPRAPRSFLITPATHPTTGKP
jgi:hypothetical protein